MESASLFEIRLSDTAFFKGKKWGKNVLIIYAPKSVREERAHHCLKFGCLAQPFLRAKSGEKMY